jgi:hypothetical protein
MKDDDKELHAAYLEMLERAQNEMREDQKAVGLAGLIIFVLLLVVLWRIFT